MANAKSAWGIEVGAFAVKAVRLEREGEALRVSDFVVIPHRKVLTTPDLDPDEMIRLTLGQLISEKDFRNQTVVVSVPGHAAFARFAKLPPVEPKKIPDIVRFEAVQQIPFPIEDVEWDYQTFADPEMPEVEVGIFAITKERIAHLLSLYGELGIEPKVVNLSPVAAFNAINFDLGLAERPGPLVILDIGTTASDLIVAEAGKCWVRTFPLGGTHFTEAIAESFSLSYAKAEKLKQEASSSKYARQIMQAMRPVFGDLLGDVQKSLSYYQSLNRGVELTEILGVGSTFRIPGLRKFLGQQLQCEVARLDEFRRIGVTGAAGADFAASTVNLATAYGLALQGLGLANIDVNLAPVPVLRQQVWAAKSRWFAAAAAVVVAAGGLMFLRGSLDSRAIESGRIETDQLIQSTVSRATAERNRLNELQAAGQYGFTAENMRRLGDDREVWPHIIRDVAAAIGSAEPQAALLDSDIATVKSIPPPDRRLVMLEDLGGRYENRGGARVVSLTMSVRFSHRDRADFLNDTVAAWLRQAAAEDRPHVPYRIIPNSISLNVPRMRTVRVGAAGDTLADAGGGRARGGDPAARGRDRGGDQAASHGFGGMGGVGGMGGRNVDAEVVSSPGDPFATGGGLMGGGGGGQPAVAPPRDTRRPAGRRAGEGVAKDPSTVDLDALAPIPTMPELFSEGQEYHEAEITFSVELKGPAGGDLGGGRGADEGGFQ